MGCDIHLILEKRYGDKWVGVDVFNSFRRIYVPKDDKTDGWSCPIARARNYERFAALAGVRGDGPAPRGLPTDASETTHAISGECGGDGHSHSWLPLMEAAKIWADTDREDMSDFAKEYPESHFFGVDISKGSRNSASNYRVVFWFDN